MKATIFATKKKTKQGKEFHTYFTKLKKKDGTVDTISVKFADEIKPKPESCPLNIIYNKEDANISTKPKEKDDGTIWEDRNLWIKAYTEDPEKFRDTSLDEYED